MKHTYLGHDVNNSNEPVFHPHIEHLPRLCTFNLELHCPDDIVKPITNLRRHKAASRHNTIQSIPAGQQCQQLFESKAHYLVQELRPNPLPAQGSQVNVFGERILLDPLFAEFPSTASHTVV